MPNIYPRVYGLNVHADQYIMVKQKRKLLVDRLSTNKKASKVTGHSLEQTNTQRNATVISTGYTPKTLSMKNRYCDRRLKELL